MRGNTAWLLLLGLAGALALGAQTTTGTITGAVHDSSNAIVVDAKVQLTNTGTGNVNQAATDANGNFRFLLLPPGNYSIQSTAHGFKTFRRDGIVVEADRSLAVPITLEIGQTTETVEVTAGTPLLEPNTSTLGTVMAQRKVQDLPLNGRNYMALANLIPTVRGVGSFGGWLKSTWGMGKGTIGGGPPLSN